MSFNSIKKFEDKIAEFFGAPYAVAVDCCTHGIELCLRRQNIKCITVPKRTYLSIPFLSHKLNIELKWKDENWEDYYYIGDTNIIDAAVLWKKNSYIPNTFMCISFQFKKHLPIGRGGMILLDNFLLYEKLKRLAHDGRTRGVIQDDDDVTEIGYHYYMTPEDAARGILLMTDVQDTISRKWSYKNYKDLTELSVFSRKNNAQESA